MGIGTPFCNKDPELTTQSVSVRNLRISILNCKTSTEAVYLHSKSRSLYSEKKPDQLFRLFRVIS